MKKRLAVYGAGGLGREIAWMIKDTFHDREVIGFFDDGKAKDTLIDGLPVMGGLNELNKLDQATEVVVAIADPMTRSTLVSGIFNTHINFPVIIHPTCLKGDPHRNRFGRGTILTAGVILTTNITLGDFVIVNLASTIGHDVQIGSYSTIMPGCSVSGSVEIGESCMMGTGARTLQNISIGEGSIIGAGAVVTKSFPAKSKLLGVPARKV